MNFNSPILKFTLCLFVLFFGLWLVRDTSLPVAHRPAELKLEGRTMGTTYHIVLADLEGDATLAELQALVDTRLEQINQMMSTYLPDSELSQFNQARSTDWIDVPAELYALIERAQQFSTITNGAFDITVGPAVNLWQFGPRDITQQRTLPEDTEVTDALSVIGFQHLHLHPDRTALRKEFSELYVDLSAIAKGYAVDQIVELLSDYPIGSGCMVEIGGEVGTVGVRLDGSAWKIGIQAPDSLPGTLTARIDLSDTSMATSGDYFNFFQVDGNRYSHTIDPTTARPVTHKLTSTVVVTENCADADAWATALLVMGPVQAYDIARQHDLAVMLFSRTDTKITSQQSPAFEKVITQEK